MAAIKQKHVVTVVPLTRTCPCCKRHYETNINTEYDVTLSPDNELIDLSITKISGDLTDDEKGRVKQYLLNTYLGWGNY